MGAPSHRGNAIRPLGGALSQHSPHHTGPLNRSPPMSTAITRHRGSPAVRELSPYLESLEQLYDATPNEIAMIVRFRGEIWGQDKHFGLLGQSNVKSVLLGWGAAQVNCDRVNELEARGFQADQHPSPGPLSLWGRIG